MNTPKFIDRILGLQTNLLNFAYTLTLDRDAAYDLLQDTTLKVLDSEDKYTAGTNFKGWVFTIMRNLFINNYRRNVRSATIVDKSEDLYQINSSDVTGDITPENTYAAKEINQIIQTFPEIYSKPFSMYVAGYRYAEIADSMDLPIGTVKSRIYYVRHALRTILD